jgi:hypothetical protein
MASPERLDGPSFRRRTCELGYVIAAYAIVIGSVVGYGIWVRGQRRKLMRPREPEPGDESV